MASRSVPIGTCTRIALVTALFISASGPTAHADAFAKLPVISPIRTCEELKSTSIEVATRRAGSVDSSEIIGTEKGRFCKVTSTVAPALLITTYLPAERWTQRFFQGRGGENPSNGFSEAGTCQPALDGEFAYTLTNVRFTMVVGSLRGPSIAFHPDPDRILDYSYRGNHVANQVSRALMRAYYGREPRYSYFVGCSDGGRQALQEAERFPEDFDGIGAGSPGILSTAEESTFHIWKIQANQRPDGTIVLSPSKVALLHEAVIGHCSTLSGVDDGILQDPSACRFDPRTMQCAANAHGTDECFTGEELSVIQKLYDGAHDRQGHYFYFGLPRGSEALWNLPATIAEEEPSASTHATQLAYILLPEPTPSWADYRNIVISRAAFERASARSRMFDAASTDLNGFASRGGKLVLWHGLNDVMIPARATMAYLSDVERVMGLAATQKFVRAFYPPGVGHCGGGNGYTELDILSALMNWVEGGEPPSQILAGKTPKPSQVIGAADVIQPGVTKPYAAPQPPLIAVRPLYPSPSIARYDGTGDPADANHYRPFVDRRKPWPDHAYVAVQLMGPYKPADFEVRQGQIGPIRE